MKGANHQSRMRARWQAAVAIGAAAATASCVLGPNYKRPDVQVPQAFRDIATNRGNQVGPATQPEAGAPSQPSLASLADLHWFDLFKDDTLTALVNTALQQNFDLQIAVERVLQARERYVIVRADRFPFVDGSAVAGSTRTSQVGVLPFPRGADPDVAFSQVRFSFGWEVDVWGRVRRLTEGARARYLASEEGRRGVVTTLIADVTQTYFALRALDLQREIATRTRQVALDSLRLTELRRDRGVATGLDVRQAEQLLYTASGQIASVERQIAQTENALSVLMGETPGDVARGQSLESFEVPPVVPSGLPASLLERRPDIRQAEQELVAANAQIGAAKAAYFPKITLTGFLGLESRALSDLLSSAAGAWNADASAVAPIFNAGRTRATVRLAESVERELVVNYRRTIYTALREVSDSLAAYRKTNEERVQQENLIAALRESTRLSTERYQGGIDSYLQVLDAERNLFSAELGLAALRRQELAAIVELYRALGGGWMPT